MKRKAPCYKGGGRIKGDPIKPNKTTIDRSLYQEQLSKPIMGEGTNVVGDSQETFSPEVLNSMGYNYVSGTMGGKDIVYEKDGNLHLYNEQPNSTQNKFGLINIGNPNAVKAKPVVTPELTRPVSESTSIDPNRKPLNLNNPNLTLDPNTGNYYNPVTKTQIQPIVEQYKHGGKVKSKLVKGYASAGSVTAPDPEIGTTNDYIAARERANQANDPNSAQKQANKKAAAAQFKGAATSALGAYGTAYYASNPGETKGDQARSGIMAGVSQAGPIGAVIGGIAGIGDKIGGPIKQRNEKVDENGNLVNEDAAKRGAILGGLLSPSKALSLRSSYKGGWTDLSGDAYASHLEDKAKEEIAAKKAEEAKKLAIVNEGRLDSAIMQRDMGDLSMPSYANGGKIVGKGTAKSDSIRAKIVPGSFVVPAENAEVIEEVKEKVLRKAPSKKANLNQNGGVDVKLSNGEVLLTPEEKMELEMKGVDVDSLAPDAQGGEDVEFKKGGEIGDKDFEKKELEKIEAQRKADAKRLGDAQAKVKADQAKAALRVKIYNSLEKQAADKKKSQSEYEKNKREYEAIKKAYDTYDKESTQNLKRKETKVDRMIGASGRETPENVSKQKENLLKQLQEKKSALDKSKVDLDFASDEKNYVGDLAPKKDNSKGGLDYLGGDKKTNIPSKTGAELENATATTDNVSGGKKAPSRKSTTSPASNTGFNSAEWAARNEGPDDVPIVGTQPEKVTLASPDIINPTVLEANQTPAQTNANGQPKPSPDYSRILSSALNYGLPIAQTAIGLKQLKDLGKRPVDEIDPEYLSAIGKTRSGVTQAEQNAKFGFTGLEKAAIEQQNTNLTNAGRFNARSLSGGSGVNALNMERAVINDSFGRSLNSKISDNALKMQKQEVANNRQMQLNDMLLTKENLGRRLFTDTLSGWQQDQAAGSQLVGAGINNLIGANRYENERKAMEKRGALETSWLNNLGK